jgi:PHP family Zn ribbon phosphoesterase
VPLNEIIAESFGMQVGAGKVKTMFDKLCDAFGTEIEVLLKASIKDIAEASTAKIAEGIKKVRGGDIVIRPGFDGEYGIVKIWQDEDKTKGSTDANATKEQLGIDF